MRKLLQDPDPQVQSAAKNALERIPPAGESATTRKPD